MWLLQRKNIHKKNLLWLKIIALCLSFHLIALLWVFCIYQENTYMQAFSVNKQMDYSTPILFLPYAAKAAQGTPKKMDVTITEAPKKIAVKTTATAKVATPKPTPEKTVVKATKPEPKKTTTIAVPATQVEAKKATEPIKKVAPADEIKPVIPEKPVIEEKIEIAEKKPEPKKAEPTTPVKTIESPPAIAQPTPAVTPIRNAMEDGPKNAHVSNNFREVEALRRGAQLQKELVQKWQPPVGVSPDCACDISFFVTKQGTIENLKMVKSSGVMIFDISARQALFAMKMPQWTYGKPLIINFK